MYLCDELRFALPTRIFYGLEQLLLAAWQRSFVTRRDRLLWSCGTLQWLVARGVEWGDVTPGRCEAVKPLMTPGAFDWAHQHGMPCSCGIHLPVIAAVSGALVAGADALQQQQQQQL